MCRPIQVSEGYGGWRKGEREKMTRKGYPSEVFKHPQLGEECSVFRRRLRSRSLLEEAFAESVTTTQADKLCSGVMATHALSRLQPYV